MSLFSSKAANGVVRLSNPNSKTKQIALAVSGLFLLAAAAKLLFFSGARYLVLTHDLPPGVQITTGRFTQVQAQLGALGGQYLSPQDQLSGVTAHTIAAGTLIAKTDLVAKLPAGQTRVVVATKTLVSKSIRVGAAVEVWSVKRQDNVLQPPVQLAARATVSQLIKPEGVFSAQSQQVELLVARDSAPLILDSVAADAAIFLVPLP